MNTNSIFEKLLKEKIDIFKYLFSKVSHDVFFDENGKLTHPGEYGAYREVICKDFIRFFIPKRLDIDSGFIINTSNEVSHQCDIIIYDSKSTPLIESGERQRFFPIETVVAVGEIKSKVNKQELAEALNKLSELKQMREKIKTPTIIRRERSADGKFPFYNPKDYPYDQIFTFLICQNFEGFKSENIPVITNSLYKNTLDYRYRHNMVLSIEDGILLYRDKNNKDFMYPFVNGESLTNRFVQNKENLYASFKLFASFLFLATSSATILYPETADYMGTIEGGLNFDEPKQNKPN